MRFRMARPMVLWAAVFALTAGFATPSAAQVFTGRIDATVNDSTGAAFPASPSISRGPQNQSAVTDAQGQAHFLNLPLRHLYASRPSCTGFNDYTEQQRAGRRPAAATPSQGQARPSPASHEVASHRGDAGDRHARRRRPPPTSRSTSCRTFRRRATRGSCCRPCPASIVDRVNVGGSESGQQSNYIAQGRVRQRQHLEHRRHPGHRHGRDRLVADLLRLRHVPGDGRSRPAAPTPEPDPGVQLNMVLKKRHEHAARQTRIYFENEEPAVEQHVGRISPPTHRRRPAARATAPTSTTTTASSSAARSSRIASGCGAARPDRRQHHHPDRRATTAPICKNYAFKADRPGHERAIRGNFTFFRGNKEKNGRSAGATRRRKRPGTRPARPSMYKGEGNFVARPTACSCRRKRARTSSGGFDLAPVGGLNTDYYIDDAGCGHGTCLTVHDQPAAGYRRRSTRTTSAASTSSSSASPGARRRSTRSDAWPGNGI